MIFYHVWYHAATLWMRYHDLSGHPCIQLLWYCLQDTTPEIYHTQDSIQLLLENITCNIYIKRQMLRKFMLINQACKLKGQFNVDHQWCVCNGANYLGSAHMYVWSWIIQIHHWRLSRMKIPHLPLDVKNPLEQSVTVITFTMLSVVLQQYGSWIIVLLRLVRSKYINSEFQWPI